MILDERFWNIYMQIYDLGVATLHPYQQLLDEVIGLLPENLDHSVVVETGCGTGNVLKRLFATHNPDSVYGLERDGSAVQIARGKLREHDAVSKIIIAKSDLNADGWSGLIEEQSDVVLSVNVLYALENPERYLRQVRSFLKPGGRFIISNPYIADVDPILQAQADWVRQFADAKQRDDELALLWAREVIEVMNRRLARHAKQKKLHFLPPMELASRIAEAGFRIEGLNPRSYAGVNVTVRAIAV